MGLGDKYDLAIVGSGIIGISAGIAALESNPRLKVLILDKERIPGAHASGRNSGVLHAGFYYSPESLKARFCKEGNVELKKFARNSNVPINSCGKVVVARNHEEVKRLELLFQRGIANGVQIELLKESKLREFDSSARTVEKFIWSPNTSVVEPKALLSKLLEHYLVLGGKIEFNSRVSLQVDGEEVLVVLNGAFLNATKVINSAGAYSDLLAREIGVGINYAAIPFKGNYRKSGRSTTSKTLVYPVPHPINPFLGVHTTLTPEGFLKIGPTAMIALGRENYRGLSGIEFHELVEILKSVIILAKSSKHDILEILKLEFPLLFARELIREAAQLSTAVSGQAKWERTQSGIRSQLVDVRSGELVQDFVVERYSNSLHFLNLVSPGWTSAFPFTRYFVHEFIQ